MSWYVYMMRCADDTLYCGMTDDIEKRLKTHNSGKGAKYTRSRLPVTPVYSEECPTRSYALKRERAIKGMTRKQKLKLIKGISEN